MRSGVLLSLLLPLAFLSPISHSAEAQSWTLTWSDEFNGPTRSRPDPTKWGYETGGGGWGNKELEYYTDRQKNSFIDGNGNLVIKVRKEKYRGPDGVARKYTSARLFSKARFQQTYGRFEARIKLPSGQGIWPAFWLLGVDIDIIGWPNCGEIDIMENKGSEPGINHGSLHGPGFSGGGALTATYALPGGQRFSDDFHVFSIEWGRGFVRFYIDGVSYQTRTQQDVPAQGRWVFDHPFYILLNVAVGGLFVGDPDKQTEFPQTMLVDYVRVYEDKNK